MIGGRLLLKRGVLPHKFECQGKKAHHARRKRAAASKRDHHRNLQEALASDHVSQELGKVLSLIAFVFHQLKRWQVCAVQVSLADQLLSLHLIPMFCYHDISLKSAETCSVFFFAY